MLWLIALLFAAPQNVMNAGGGNALTLPAARHVVRLAPGNGSGATWLLAVQQDGADGHWLSMYRSTDEGQTWRWYAPIQDACCERDTPDLIQVGTDVALVYSYEGPEISGSTAHDVYFQWWRWNRSADWTAQSPVRVFDSTSSSTGYLRAEIARDSQGRLWVWAQRLNSDGTFTMVMSVSTDGGASFQAQPSLDTFSNRPGGRIMAVAGNQMMLLYGTHGTDPGYMRMRSDSDALGTWSARQVVFSEGLYHGAALSSADDGSGGVHLVYKDVGEQLWYRHWSGSWGAKTQIESSADWALQPAITRVGGSLVIFWNRMLTTNTNYQFRYKVLSNGTFSSSVQLDGSSGFKGYPASVESLPNTVPQIPCLYGKTPDANSSGTIALVFAPTPDAAPLPPPPPDGGTPDAGTPDAGTPDAGTPDAGTPDAGTPPPQTGVLFSDDFNRTSGMGSAWRINAGLWRTPSTRAESDLDGTDQATVQSLSCADCSVQARVVNFAAGSVALELRVSAANSRYAVALLGNGHLQIQRRAGSTITVLGDVASGVADLGDWATIGLSATGAGPVQLVATVNGSTKLTVTDSSSSAITAPGTAGMSTALAGIWFDDFVVTGLLPSGGGGGTPDAGTPDAGTPDAGTPDAGTPDAGTPDAGTPDAGTPDAGTPDAGTPDAGTPPPQTGVLFTDDFNRTSTTDLGPRWTILAGLWRDDNRANSDLDALDRAAPAGVSCRDCRVDAKMVNYAGGEAMLELRASGNDRYALALTTSGRLEFRRYRSGSATVLGSVASGISDLGVLHSFSFAVQGTAPVTLTAFLDGVAKMSGTDSSTSALTAAGASGIAATVAGIHFDDFTLSGTGQVDNPPPDGGTPDAGTPDAGTPDAGIPDAGTPDAGTPDGGPVDGGAPDAGPADGGTKLAATVTYTETGFDLMAVDPSGTAYGVNLNASSSQVWSTVDGRSWSKRGATPGGESFSVMTALSDGTLLADVSTSSGHALARSTDHGVTWKVVLNTGSYRSLTPHSFAELDGAVYFVEYQVFTTSLTPVRLWKSSDRGATWSVQFTFQGHRNGHGLMPDPARHALFAFFGDFDSQSGLFRSTDGGASWTMIIGNKQAGDIVDGVVLSDGAFLCGQDISYRGSTPDTPRIARIGLDGSETDYQELPSASYSTHAVSTGGYVVGATYEIDNDVSPAGWTRGSIWGSGDGMHWQKLLDVPRLSSSDDVRTDVYWELATGELVVNVRNASGFGPDGRGYLLLHTIRQ